MANSLQNESINDSVDFSSLAGNIDGDWQEETFQKIKSMNAMYHSDLSDIYLRVSAKLLEEETRNGQIEKLRYFNAILVDLLMFVRSNKDDIQPSHNEKIAAVEELIVNILSSNMPCKAVLQPGKQASQSQMHNMQQPHITQMHGHECLTSLQHNSCQNNMDTLQPGSKIDPGLGSETNPIQQINQIIMSFISPGPEIASSSKRKREHEIDPTGTINIELIPKIQRLAERAKSAVTKNQLEEIVHELNLNLNALNSPYRNKLISYASWAITKHLSEYEDTQMKMVLKDDAEVFLAMKMQTWIRLVKLASELL